MDGSSSHALSNESSHGRKNVRTPFASTGVGKLTHLYHCCEVLLPDYLRSSTPHSPVGTGTILGSGIGYWDHRLNFTPG